MDYYKDGKFINLGGDDKKTFWGYLAMRWRTKQEKWPDKVPLKDGIPRPPANSESLRIQYINHSSFLVQHRGINILTDPVFSERTSPVSWAGPKRVIEPGVSLKDLPKIDVIIISHDHYDHLDISSLRALHERDQPKILLGLKAGRVFDRDENFKELAWWDKEVVKGVTFHFTQVQHFSGRTLFDRNSTLWGGFFIESGDVKIYFGGDTGYGDHFTRTRERLGAPDIALLPIGAYNPRSFMAFQHMDPEESVKAHRDLEARSSIGMHWGTFQLTNEKRLDPKDRIEKQTAQDSSLNFLVPENGDCFQMNTERKVERCSDTQSD